MEGRHFHVHKQILGVSSAVFDAMFSSDFVEKDAKTVPLPGKKSDDVEKLLRVIYPCFRDHVDGEWMYMHMLHFTLACATIKQNSSKR